MIDERTALVIWAAGFFDGEGTVGLVRTRMGGRIIDLRIRVGQKTPEALQPFMSLWGGSIYHRQKPTDFYIWAKGSRPALNALLEMEPYLIVKHPHVQVAKELMIGVGIRGGTRGPGKGNGALPIEEQERRNALQQAMKLLNRRLST